MLDSGSTCRILWTSAARCLAHQNQKGETTSEEHLLISSYHLTNPGIKAPGKFVRGLFCRRAAGGVAPWCVATCRRAGMLVGLLFDLYRSARAYPRPDTGVPLRGCKGKRRRSGESPVPFFWGMTTIRAIGKFAAPSVGYRLCTDPACAAAHPYAKFDRLRLSPI